MDHDALCVGRPRAQPAVHLRVVNVLVTVDVEGGEQRVENAARDLEAELVKRAPELQLRDAHIAVDVPQAEEIDDAHVVARQNHLELLDHHVGQVAIGGGSSSGSGVRSGIRGGGGDGGGGGSLCCHPLHVRLLRRQPCQPVRLRPLRSHPLRLFRCLHGSLLRLRLLLLRHCGCHSRHPFCLSLVQLNFLRRYPRHALRLRLLRHQPVRLLLGGSLLSLLSLVRATPPRQQDKHALPGSAQLVDEGAARAQLGLLQLHLRGQQHELLHLVEAAKVVYRRLSLHQPLLGEDGALLVRAQLCAQPHDLGRKQILIVRDSRLTLEHLLRCLGIRQAAEHGARALPQQSKTLTDELQSLAPLEAVSGSQLDKTCRAAVEQVPLLEKHSHRWPELAIRSLDGAHERLLELTCLSAFRWQRGNAAVQVVQRCRCTAASEERALADHRNLARAR